MSIPATKGFEIGSGFEGSKMKGSEHNDAFYCEDGGKTIKTKTNYAGGTLGGISNGENIVLFFIFSFFFFFNFFIKYFKVAFKPVSTIGLA